MSRPKIKATTVRSSRMKNRRGFTLVEAMISMVLAGIVVASAVTSYRVGLAQSADQRREWNAFTIAQAQMELLSATSTTAPVLADSTPDILTASALGTSLDANCSAAVDGSKSLSMVVDEFGNASVDQPYVLCWKVTTGSPSGTLINLRVVTGYLDDFQNWQYVILQNIIGGSS